jgi:hypothetical protein
MMRNFRMRAEGEEEDGLDLGLSGKPIERGWVDLTATCFARMPEELREPNRLAFYAGATHALRLIARSIAVNGDQMTPGTCEGIDRMIAEVEGEVLDMLRTMSPGDRKLS